MGNLYSNPQHLCKKLGVATSATINYTMWQGGDRRTAEDLGHQPCSGFMKDTVSEDKEESLKIRDLLQSLHVPIDLHTPRIYTYE